MAMAEKKLCCNSQYWPEEILTEILALLPVKSLVRFRCVCKSWRALIRSPYFVDKHLSHYSDRRPLVYVRGVGGDMSEDRLLDLHCQNDEEIVRARYNVSSPKEHCHLIFGSCNGILCLVDVEFFIYLYNPTMGEYLKLPPNLCQVKSYSYRLVGFAFVPSSNDYKIIKVVTAQGNRHPKAIFKAEIYEVSTNAWRMIDGDWGDIAGTSIWRDSGVLVNGIIYWCLCSHGNYLPQRLLIRSFDMNREAFGKMKPPNLDAGTMDSFGPNADEDNLASSNPNLAVLHDSLAFILRKPIENTSSFDVWIMESGSKDSWTKKYSVGPVPRILEFLTFWNDTQLLLLLEGADGYLISCPLQNGSERRRKIPFWKYLRECPFVGAVSFQETLASLSPDPRYS